MPDHSQALFSLPPILGAQQRGDSADGRGVDSNRQTLLTQLGLDTKAKGFIVLHVGNHAAVVGDEYVRITVFLAAVLFLVGIGSTFKLPTVRYVLIVVGAVLLVLATVLILIQPGLPA